MACRLGICESRPRARKPQSKSQKPRASVVADSSSEWSESDASCSGCSACCGSTSSCSCSECNMETDSSDGTCYGYACRPRAKKSVAKKSSGNKKVLKCKDGVCEWVSKNKIKKPTKTRKPAKKTEKPRKT